MVSSFSCLFYYHIRVQKTFAVHGFTFLKDSMGGITVMHEEEVLWENWG